MSTILVASSKQKIDNVVKTIDGLRQGQFPGNAGKDALDRIKANFLTTSARLDRAAQIDDAVAIQSYASDVTLKVLQALPVLGFILRSVNVRNAFEFLDPLRILASQALGGDPLLILSSEWDYIPFEWQQPSQDLPDFVFIGLPASEAANPLVIPLAGHELGHAVWRKRRLDGGINATLSIIINDLYQQNLPDFRHYRPEYDPGTLFGRDVLSEAVAYSLEFAISQAVELFCDMFAYAVFGESYLHAFSYIIAPGTGFAASPSYPTHQTRISTLQTIAYEEGVTLPSALDLGFSVDPRQANARASRFDVRMAEQAVSKIVSALWKEVRSCISVANIIRPNQSAATKHLEELRLGSPASDPICIGDIINAGWKYYFEINVSIIESEPRNRQISSLNEMILKTVEILEYKRRTGDGT